MFNLQGSELVFLLLIALIVLGPEKLPEAIRKFGEVYGQFRQAAGGFQAELKNALDEPARELRSTADELRKAASFDIRPDLSPAAASTEPLPGNEPPLATPAAVAPEAETTPAPVLADVVDDSEPLPLASGFRFTSAAPPAPLPPAPLPPPTGASALPAPSPAESAVPALEAPEGNPPA